ncbi:MAG: response regulator [Gammaproteobacteria bacterium]|nr:response regulator [Gammaproteobacteria bacterium]MCB1924186.1 response regulator [Gammaproteobacteria bacterium]
MNEITLADLVVLVVEPSSTQRRIVANALHNNGIETVLECENGSDALARLAGDAPDLVISSLYLPDMTGTDLVHRIRSGDSKADTPFMLISSETRFRYLDPIRQAGAVAILPKPFGDRELHTALRATLDLLSEESMEDIAELDLRVLVVDDSSMARKHVTRVLNSLGIEHVDHAGDGIEALEMIRDHLYDFVVTDYNMPRMDGSELIDHIRKDSASATLPVLMVTSEENENRLAAVQQSGVAAICDKPFEPAHIRGLVRQMVEV